MKKNGILVLLLLLSGCSSDMLTTRSVETSLEQAQTLDVYNANYSKEYYSYYLEPCIGRLNGDSTSNTFDYYGIKFIMNLNVASVLQDAYYDTEEQTVTSTGMKENVYSLQGSYVTKDGNKKEFLLEVNMLNDAYIVYMQAGYMEFFSVVNANEIAPVAEKMLYMARSVSVNTDRVKRDFSLRNDITYTAKKVELFQNLVPENGSIDELFENGTNTLSPESTTPPSEDGKQ